LRISSSDKVLGIPDHQSSKTESLFLSTVNNTVIDETRWLEGLTHFTPVFSIQPYFWDDENFYKICVSEQEMRHHFSYNYNLDPFQNAFVTNIKQKRFAMSKVWNFQALLSRHKSVYQE